jgi:hypothetical protein
MEAFAMREGRLSGSAPKQTCLLDRIKNVDFKLELQEFIECIGD